ncbi:MAG: MFS transporter [Acidisphaera sp.]|nr:MFS transporter [Acidisphaera sp.]
MPETTRQQRHVVAACYLGWTLDAFDFFIMVFVFADVAREFGTTITVVTWAITLTLLMRALGAFLFGRFADRFGRRPALMASILGYSILEFASGFAPNLTVFLILRALFGIAMGGEWGIGASLTMESIPARWRGPVSGMLQAGYPTGYLLASILNGLAHESLGWRGMFMVGAVPALLVLYIRSSVPESPDFVRMAQRPRPGVMETIRANVGLTIYAVIMMMAFNFFSHGTQDLYPTYLTVQRHLPRPTLTTIVVIYNLGAMIGGVAFGYLSQRIGRRVAIVIAALLAIPVVWPWAFGGDAVMLGIGAFLMQICVQGAWGVIPAHLNELSPPAVRATFPGVTYQLGNFLAAANATIQSSIADSMGHDFRYALAGTACVVAVLIAVLVGFGTEARERRMGDEAEPVGAH